MSEITENLSRYVKDRKINLSALARETGVAYPALYASLGDDKKDRSLRDYELVAICIFLDVDPRIFAGKEGEKEDVHQ